MQEIDLSPFDKSVTELFELSQNIIETYESHHLSLNHRKNPILVRLQQYIKTYEKTEPKEHLWYFEQIYKKNKAKILRGPKRDSWVLDGNIIITYGEDAGIKTNIKIHISSIYHTACKIRDETEKDIEGLPDVEQTEELVFPYLYLLHLYRIFCHIAKPSDKDKMQDHVKYLENEIGIKETTTKSSQSNNDPMSSLFDMATGMMEKMGVNVPKEKMPDQKDFSNMLGNVINNPKTKSMIGNMMQEMQNTSNIGDMVNKLIGNLSGPDETTGENEESQIENTISKPLPTPPKNVENGKGENQYEDLTDEFAN